MAQPRVVIIGAGHAGGSAAAFLRQYGWTGEILLIGDELEAPYQRPPLSKAWLKGEADAEALELRPRSFYAEADIGLWLGATVASIDVDRRQLALTTAEAISYDALILATGARARRLPVPGAGLRGVHELRTIAHAEDLKTAIAPGHRVAIIGGGYIGLEAAASVRALGGEALVIEREGRLLARVASQPISDAFEAYHRAQGVEILLAAEVAELEGRAGHVAAARLADGRRFDCDLALVGVGSTPNDEIAQLAGLACENGIIVDHEARTSAPDVFAAGDVTRRPLPFFEDRWWRLESVPNALEQARQAAAAICGAAQPAPELPWFWSDQYDLKLQIAGLPFEAVRTVVRGAPDDMRFAVFQLDAQDRVRAVEAVNLPDAFMGGRQLISGARVVDAAALANPEIRMKAILAGAQ